MTAALFDRSEPDAANGFQQASARLIVASHARLLHRELLPGRTADDLGRRLYGAPFIVLAHDAAPDPLFFYANLAAQELFAMSWREIVRLPSRLSAEPLAREERQRLLDRVARDGFIADYGGERRALPHLRRDGLESRHRRGDVRRAGGDLCQLGDPALIAGCRLGRLRGCE